MKICIGGFQEDFQVLSVKDVQVWSECNFCHMKVIIEEQKIFSCKNARKRSVQKNDNLIIVFGSN